MGFDFGVKVTALCAVTLASNLVLATEVRVANKTGNARALQTKRVPTEPVEVTENVVEKPQDGEHSVVNAPTLDQEIIPIEKEVSPLDLKGVRG
jgi:hypothetical protein